MKKKYDKNINKYMKHPFYGMYFTGAVFCVMVIVLCIIQRSVPYTLRDESIRLIPEEEIMQAKMDYKVIDDSGFLVVDESSDPVSKMAMEVLVPVLDQMKLSYKECDISSFDNIDIDKYTYIILVVNHYQLMSERIVDVKNWVKAGGNLMIMFPPEYSGSFMAFADILGIDDCGGYVKVGGITTNYGFMIGGNKEFSITEPFDSSLAITISEECRVYMESTDQYPVPLIWRRECGEGSVVFDNFAIFGKAYRGIHGSAISLMGDGFVYPVINAATFYIDDFPSPVPEGDGKYISRDYDNLTIADFYSQVWWNDIYEIATKHGIRFTGLVIENYNDQIEGIWYRNEDTGRYRYFGNMLLKSGGEIGIHGYNHMPLVLENFDYADMYNSYIQWRSREDMHNAIEEVIGFTHELFPKESLNVYVPPSNVLSDEGREVLKEHGIKSIASVYLDGDYVAVCEFGVGEDGMINTPRVISGYILDDFDKLTALSELNLHLVSTHFQHPDDVLDEDRGATLGWEEMSSRLAAYADWLYDAYPNIRNLTGSELAAAVERYDVLEVSRTIKDDEIILNLENYYDEAYMLMRLNDEQGIEGITGGTYDRITDNLYLICCTKDEVKISLNKEK